MFSMKSAQLLEWNSNPQHMQYCFLPTCATIWLGFIGMQLNYCPCVIAKRLWVRAQVQPIFFTGMAYGAKVDLKPRLLSVLEFSSMLLFSAQMYSVLERLLHVCCWRFGFKNDNVCCDVVCKFDSRAFGHQISLVFQTYSEYRQRASRQSVLKLQSRNFHRILIDYNIFMFWK